MADSQGSDKIEREHFSESDKCVFLLGAGFSAAHGPPVMNNFMGASKEQVFRAEEDGSRPISSLLLREYARIPGGVSTVILGVQSEL
jgi:hypothetical protein